MDFGATLGGKWGSSFHQNLETGFSRGCQKIVKKTVRGPWLAFQNGHRMNQKLRKKQSGCLCSQVLVPLGITNQNGFLLFESMCQQEAMCWMMAIWKTSFTARKLLHGFIYCFSHICMCCTLSMYEKQLHHIPKISTHGSHLRIVVWC